MSRFPLLAQTLAESPVIRFRSYDYFVHPVTDGVPQVDPRLLAEVVDGFRARLPRDFDKILAPEAMGVPLAAVLAMATGRPYTVARKRAYGLPGEVVVRQRTGYGESEFHVLGLGRGQRILVVDDVVSTGNTLRALVEACRKAGAEPMKVLLAINKNVDLAKLGQELGCPVEALVRLQIDKGRVLVEA